MLKSAADFINNRILGRLGIRLVRTKWLQEDSILDQASSFAGEEAVLADLIKDIAPATRYYVDIGASDGTTWSNTVALARNGWHGLCFECDSAKIAAMASTYRTIGGVSVCQARITPMNVCGFLRAYGVSRDFGVLSVDIDSYDWFVLKAVLSEFRPTIVVAEINEKIPPPLEFTVLYDASYVWDGSHFYGMSIAQMEKLSKEYNYGIVRLEYNNVFLIDGRKYHGRCLSADEAYDSGYRNRADRQKKFPWNADMEEALGMSPEEATSFVSRVFEKYAGRYSLSYSDESDIADNRRHSHGWDRP
ncbi:MAG: hypothetical protein JXN60_01430 [Lentisphaerae bacterium]|nr:hypothetical protein [Lentisphaerota bacterium]